MLVSEILRKKSGSTITMNPHDDVETAIRMFKEKKIGAILVCGLTGDLVGIITERDVLHAMATHGAATYLKNGFWCVSWCFNTCPVLTQSGYPFSLQLPLIPVTVGVGK